MAEQEEQTPQTDPEAQAQAEDAQAEDAQAEDAGEAPAGEEASEH